MVILSEIILFCSILALMLIVFIYQPRGKEKVWICSKILTIKEIIKNNANNIFPLLSIISEKKMIH